MSKHYFFRVVRFATIALFLAAGVDGLRQVIFPHPSIWQSHIATILLCAFVVVLLSVGSVCLEQTSDKDGVFAANLPCDIVDQKQLDDTLFTLASIVEHSEDAIVGKTNDGVITTWNRAAEKMFGYAKAEAVGQNVSMLIPPDKRNEFAEIRKHLGAGHSVECLETQRLTKSGTKLNVSLSIFPIKNRRGRIVGAVARDITLHKRADEQLRLQSAALEAAANAIVITNQTGTIVWVNRAFTKLTGYSEGEILGKNPRLLKSGEHPESYYTNLWATISSGKVWQGEIVNRRKDGTTYTEEMTITPVIHSSDNGDHTHFIAIKQDISDRILLQQQLQQAQKMEAVGRLAGGVAHDFNNMLAVVTGYSELLKLRNDLDESSLHQVEEIRSAAKRAASLTQQLLAFSRKQIIQPRTLDLNEILAGLGKMLRRLIGDDIELALRFSSAQALIKVDQNQLEQVVMNLVINARDAMPDGGKILIETDLCELDEAYASRHKPVIAGRYVRLSVSDTGIGMDRNTKSHLFEPFFTTKELGRGTGLGLSIVYGIVKQSEGYIWVYSEPGHGTTFKIYLPLRSAAVERTVVQPRVESVRGVETVLLVEDDTNFRTLMADFLTGLGYTILESGSGRAALEAIAKQSVPVQALITDLMMPGMGGRELANRLMATLPNLRVLYISGYTHDSAVQTRVLNEGESFLQKPFMLAELSRKLREVIDTPEQRVRAQASGGQS
jgi:two-component system, cell cycle sensor histidine kinase and response regulator CckA